MKKPLLTIATIAAAITLLNADTITWTGLAGTYAWTDAANWDLNRTPNETDDVVIDGAAVTADGNQRIPKSLTLLNNASYSIGAEIWFGNEGVLAPEIYGGTVRGTLVASQYANSSLTISDTAIIDTATGNNGFWQNGASYLNFVDGNSRAASFTYNSSLPGPGTDPWWFFCHSKDGAQTSSSPCIRYNGEVIDLATYADNFTSTENGDGTVTLSMLAVGGWRVGSVTNGAIVDNDDPTLTKKTTLSVTATKKSGNSFATVRIGWASQDYGDEISSWPQGSLSMLTDVLAATSTLNHDMVFAPGKYYVRAFVTYEESSQEVTFASAPLVIVARSHDYGGFDNVYEWIGTDNNLSDAANWEFTSGGATSTPASAPVAGTDIRWFGDGSTYSAAAFDAYSTDRFVGANVSVAGDFNAYGDLVFSNATVSVWMIVLKNGHVAVNLYGSHIYVSRTDAGSFGLYDAMYQGMINFSSGKAASYTARNSINASNKADVYSSLISNGYVTMDGAEVDQTAWDENFTTSIADGRLTISYNPLVMDNVLGTTSVSNIKDTSATASVEVVKIGTGVVLKFAYGTTEPTDQQLLADGDYDEYTYPDTVKSREMVGLTKGSTYYYRFGLLDTSNNEVLVSVGGSFVAKEYDAVWSDGAWEDGLSATLTDASARILFLSDYNASGGELASPLKVVSNATVRISTLINGTEPVVLCNGRLVTSRPTDLAAAPYSKYPNGPGLRFVNFIHNEPTNGVVHGACAYTFRYDAEVWARPSNSDIYSDLFGAGRFLIDGAEVTAEAAAAVLSIIDNPGETEGTGTVTLTTIDNLPQSTATGWSINRGAYIRLSTNTRGGRVVIADSTDVKIDLNGYNLKVSTLTVNGEKKKGEFNKDNLSILTGSGSLTVGGPGFSVFVR